MSSIPAIQFQTLRVLAGMQENFWIEQEQFLYIFTIYMKDDELWNIFFPKTNVYYKVFWLWKTITANFFKTRLYTNFERCSTFQ